MADSQNTNPANLDAIVDASTRGIESIAGSFLRQYAEDVVRAYLMSGDSNRIEYARSLLNGNFLGIANDVQAEMVKAGIDGGQLSVLEAEITNERIRDLIRQTKFYDAELLALESKVPILYGLAEQVGYELLTRYKSNGDDKILSSALDICREYGLGTLKSYFLNIMHARNRIAKENADAVDASAAAREAYKKTSRRIGDNAQLFTGALYGAGGK